MEKQSFKFVEELKQYSSERHKIRFSSFGYENTRISKISLKLLKGFLKQNENSMETGFEPSDSYLKDIDSIKRELEFRTICLGLKSVFDIKIR
jgi:hypothetical protein